MKKKKKEIKIKVLQNSLTYLVASLAEKQNT